MAAKKGVVATASAKRLHSNALLSACVKENVPQTDQKRITISHVASISTEQVMQKCVVYPIGLSLFAIHYCAIISKWRPFCEKGIVNI